MNDDGVEGDRVMILNEFIHFMQSEERVLGSSSKLMFIAL